MITSLRYKLHFDQVFYHSAQNFPNPFILMNKNNFDDLYLCTITLIKVFFKVSSGVTSYAILLTDYQNEILTLFKITSVVTG